jgi:SAM-dependent methyltransferase
MGHTASMVDVEYGAMKRQVGSFQPDDLEFREAQLSGSELYGENLGLDQIKDWYEQEKSGYFDLVANYYGLTDPDHQYAYQYEALNRLHAIGALLRRRFKLCVALGCAAGNDVAPLAVVVDRFLAVEPAEKWWRTEIGGKPAQYVKPSIMGDIELGDGVADLATSFGVLHHIPNVSHVVGEIGRVLRSGGLFAAREPISWMGDWRKPRPGLTANERGLPVQWFEKTAHDKGFRVIHRHFCMLNALTTILKKAGVARPFASMPATKLDWLMSELLRWNIRYRRDSFARKIAPGSAFWLLEKR